jgi:hypothetical protein
MLTTRKTGEPPATKIAGLVYILLGFMALSMSVFFIALPGSFGVSANFRLGICGALALYGIFRIVTGIVTVRKAAKAGGTFTFPGRTPIISDSTPENE